MLLTALALTALSCVPFLHLPSLHLAAHGALSGVLFTWYARHGLLLGFIRGIALFEILFLPCMLLTYLVWRELSQAATDLVLGRERRFPVLDQINELLFPALLVLYLSGSAASMAAQDLAFIGQI